MNLQHGLFANFNGKHFVGDVRRSKVETMKICHEIAIVENSFSRHTSLTNYLFYVLTIEPNIIFFEYENYFMKTTAYFFKHKKILHFANQQDCATVCDSQLERVSPSYMRIGPLYILLITVPTFTPDKHSHNSLSCDCCGKISTLCFLEYSHWTFNLLHKSHLKIDPLCFRPQLPLSSWHCFVCLKKAFLRWKFTHTFLIRLIFTHFVVLGCKPILVRLCQWAWILNLQNLFNFKKLMMIFISNEKLSEKYNILFLLIFVKYGQYNYTAVAS